MPTDPTLLDALEASLLQRTLDRSLSCEEVEQRLHDALMQVGRRLLGAWLSAADPGVPVVVREGRTWRRAVESSLTVESAFGSFAVKRGLYRDVRNGPTRCFVKEKAALIDGGFTPRAARIAAFASTELTSRAAAKLFQLSGTLTASRTKLERLPKTIWSVVEPDEDELHELLRTSYEIPAEASCVAVSLDGVMVKLQTLNREEGRERARDAGRKAGGPIGSSEASVGSASFYDVDGERLMTRRSARMPEPDKVQTKQWLRAELAEIRRRRPDLVVVAVSDGAPNNWTFLESLDPDYQVVDAYHTLEHVKRRLDRALGAGSHASRDQYDHLKMQLLKTPNGHVRVFARLAQVEKANGTFKVRKTRGRGAQPTFYERHSGRMAYSELLAQNLPIGSGVIEGTARYMVVDRLRRTGMRWLHHGGQAILSLRQYAANDQFDDVWKFATEREQFTARAA